MCNQVTRAADRDVSGYLPGPIGPDRWPEGLAQHQFRFFKYSGLGNDFLLIPISDSFGYLDPVLWSRRARKLCNRREGVGADGVIVYRGDVDAFDMAVVNPDGSFATMCGNATRCAVRHYFDSAGSSAVANFKYMISPPADRYVPCVGAPRADASVSVSLPLEPVFRGPYRALGRLWHYVFAGTDHIVCFIDSNAVFQRLDVERIGRAMRAHAHFQPDGTNVNFVLRSGEGRLQLRTFERGVEAETLSCATGSMAAVLADMRLKSQTHTTRTVIQSSGEALTIDCTTDADGTIVRQTGVARKLFEGTCAI